MCLASVCVCVYERREQEQRSRLWTMMMAIDGRKEKGQ